MVDLEPPARLREAQALVSQVPVRSLLLTGTPMGPLWGAMLESGVSAVLPTTTQLDEIVERLTDLMLDRPVMSEHLKQELLRAWRTVRTEQEVLIARMKSLTPREQTVLRMLYAGDGVRTISDLMGVTEATVRSQVKSVLRKLDVNSQLAAVAAFGSLRQDPDLHYSWPDE
jgi:two-component system nitrate/nitrite response regulator NarL